METNGHYPVSGIKRFFDAIAVMYVNIDVEDTGVVSEFGF